MFLKSSFEHIYTVDIKKTNNLLDIKTKKMSQKFSETLKRKL